MATLSDGGTTVQVNLFVNTVGVVVVVVPPMD
jgi:hypothetical protein